MSAIRKRIRAGVRHLFSALIILGLIAYLWQHKEDVAAGLQLSPILIIQLVVLILVTWVVNSLPMLVFARLMEVKIGFWENFAVLIASTLGNYLPMRVGTLIRMRFFKKVHNLDYATYVGIMGLRLLIMLFFTGILGSIGLAIAATTMNAVPTLLILSFSGLALFGLTALLIPLPSVVDNKKWWGRILHQLTESHRIMRSGHGVFGSLILISAAQFILLALRMYLSFQAFGVGTPFWMLLLLGPVATAITFVNLTPGNLGIREWVIGGLSGINGLDFQPGLFASTLDRSVLILCVFILGPPCLYYTLRTTRGPGRRTSKQE